MAKPKTKRGAASRTDKEITALLTTLQTHYNHTQGITEGVDYPQRRAFLFGLYCTGSNIPIADAAEFLTLNLTALPVNQVTELLHMAYSL
jgi:hypothetical protein